MNQLTKKRIRKSTATVTVLTLTALLASACGNNDNNGNASPSASATSSGSASATSSAATTTSAAPSASDEGGDAFAKYDPPIEVTTVRSTDATIKFADGDSLDSNIWTQLFEQGYGIKVKNNWVVDATQYHQKLNVTIASGDLPDFVEVNREELKRLVDADMLEDLTDVYNKYASERLKDMLSQDGGVGIKAATFGGKQYAIPRTFANGGSSTAEMIYVRTDWLKNLNLPEPKTMDDLIKTAKAFATQDPDKNGKQDTFGLGVDNDFFNYGQGSLRGFMNGFHAYPDIWVKDASGNLAFGSTQPQIKTALAALQDLYKSGAIDKEFGVKPSSKIAEEIGAGKIGLAYGFVADVYIHNVSHTNDPKAQWKVLPIVSSDDEKAVPQLFDTANSFYVVKKGAKNPEVAVKLANIYVKERYETDYTVKKDPYSTDPATKIMAAKFAPIITDPMNQNLDNYRSTQELLKTGDDSKATTAAKLTAENLKKFKDGDDTQWQLNLIVGEGGSYSVVDYYDQNGGGQYDQFQLSATPTMADKLPTLKKKEMETFTKIIMGDASVEEFDKFVADFNKLGGDTITKEINDVVSAAK
ncbi:extracellular solute-binding protein [Cohnella sp. GCM10012308]|uniref:extracellular solute-binding protein n=1 Tax=Cohnella sp. GCM10012308 TaxID=3317329 RepID=UPI003612B9AF